MDDTLITDIDLKIVNFQRSMCARERKKQRRRRPQGPGTGRSWGHLSFLALRGTSPSADQAEKSSSGAAWTLSPSSFCCPCSTLCSFASIAHPCPSPLPRSFVAATTDCWLWYPFNPRSSACLSLFESQRPRHTPPSGQSRPGRLAPSQAFP